MISENERWQKDVFLQNQCFLEMLLSNIAKSLNIDKKTSRMSQR